MCNSCDHSHPYTLTSSQLARKIIAFILLLSPSQDIRSLFFLECPNIFESFLFIVKIYFSTNSIYTTLHYLLNSCAKRKDSNILGRREYYLAWYVQQSEVEKF